jgi:multiple sugar transport system substrate-binding protein
MTLKGITRRLFTSAGLAAMLMLPGTVMGQDVIELTVLAPSSFTPDAPVPEVADLYRDIWNEFEANNPGIKLRVEQFPGGTEALRDILTRGTADNLSDLGVMDTFWVPRLHASGYLQSLEGVLSEEDKADYLKGVLEATTHDGALRAIYIYNAWRGLFYRPSVAAQVGYDAPPTDWASFLEFGRKLKEAGFTKPVMLPALLNEVTMQYSYSQFLGLGGRITDDSGKPIFHEPGNREKLEQVYAMWRELVAEGLMPAEVGTMDEAATRPFFYTGEAAVLGASTSSINQMYTDMPDLRGDLSLSPMPLPDGQSPVPLLAAWAYVVFTDDPARQEAANKFVNYMVSPDVLGRLNVAQGHIPLRNSIWDNYPEYSDSPMLQRLREIFSDPRVQERSIFPIYPAIKDAITGQMAAVIAGEITPAQAVDNAGAEAVAAFERMAD